MGIEKDLHELLGAGIISEEMAERIRAYYRGKSGSASSKLFVVFGVLGAMLVGMGIILILAHNWDELSLEIKTSLAFLPMLVGQLACGFTLWKKADSQSWREGASVFLAFAVASSIALVGQIYNIPGSMPVFLLTWFLLCLPLVYIMSSSAVSLLLWVGAPYFAIAAMMDSPESLRFAYWLLVLALAPHYFQLSRQKPNSGVFGLHQWAIVFSLSLALGNMGDQYTGLMFLAYLSLFGCFVSLGQQAFFRGKPLRENPYFVVGSLGTFITLIILSFDWFWQDLSHERGTLLEVLSSPEAFFASVFTVLAAFAAFALSKRMKPSQADPFTWAFAAFVGLYFLGMYAPVAAVFLINLLILLLGVFIVWQAAQRTHLGQLNYGLLVIVVLIACRFFDTHFSFVAKGLVFVALGIGFFLTNYYLLKKWKN